MIGRDDHGSLPLAIGWYAQQKKGRRRVLVAQVHATFTRAGRKKIKIALARAGRKLLRHARTLRPTAKGSFTPTGKPRVTATRKFTVRR